MSSIPIAAPVPAGAPGETRWPTRLAWLRRLVRREFLGLRGMSLARLAWTLAFVAGVALWSALGGLLQGAGRNTLLASGIPAMLAYWIAVYGLLYVPAALAMTLADNLPLRAVPRWLAMAAAAALALCTFPFLACATVHAGDVECRAFPPWSAFPTFTGYTVYSWYLTCLIAGVVLIRRHDRELAAALHAAQLARIDAQRGALEADLQVMQARIEPAFLFDALRDVAALYERDPRAGDRLLDSLIQYLRAALPDIRGSTTTLAQEAGLLRAYLSIVSLRSGGSLAAGVRIARGLDAARVPPMMLVPLVAPLANSRTTAAPDGGAVRVDVREIDARVRIAVTATGNAARTLADSPAVREARERLAALYGPRASLAIDRSADDRTQMIVEIPHERADRGPG